MLLFCLAISGCTLDEYIYGVVVENQNGVLKKAIHGVEFSFCLLNEKGMPAIIFKEGENFSFQLKIKNNTSEALPFNDFGFYNTYDFLMVKSVSGYVGKPVKFLRHDTSVQAQEIAPGASETFMVAWHEERGEFLEMHSYFEGLHQPHLPKGIYSTKFTYNFRFAYPDKAPVMETGKMTFLINFEIK